MVVYIVQIMNNTSRALYYNNNESASVGMIGPKDQQMGRNAGIPSSNHRLDPVPYRTSGNRIKLQFSGSDSQLLLQDDDWEFRIEGPVPYSGTNARGWYGKLEDGAKYILRVDEVVDGMVKCAGLTFLKYEDKYRVSDSRIDSRKIQHATVCVALVLFSL